MLFKTALRRDLSNLAGVVFATLFTVMVTTSLIRWLGRAANGLTDTASVLPMIAFGAIGFLLELCAVPLGPFVIGLLLAPLAEIQLRAGLMATDGSLWPILQRPVACSLLAVSAAMFAWPLWRDWRRSADARARLGTQTIGRPS
jgi:TctA family transporter